MARIYEICLLVVKGSKGGVRALNFTHEDLERLGTTGKHIGETLENVSDCLTNVVWTMSIRLMMPVTAADSGIR
ncbi:MAG: hypothetical protein DWQ08_06365 [Proteobacteria bacterium]|nr:MAG: hypothetical protein DWQ08_06365 [Pseudomonadota bacterium]